MALILDLAGPAAAYGLRLFAEAGHSVVRVEPRGGDELRRQGPFLDGKPGLESGAFHQFLNAGKQSFSLDVTCSAGCQILLDLAARADALVGNQPLAVDAKELQRVNPRLIVVRVDDGGLPEACAYARSGLLALTGLPDERPAVMGGHVVYAATGLHVAVALAAALLVQQLTGQGQVVDVSVQDCMEELGEQSMVSYTSVGRGMERRGYRGAMTAVSGAFPCADGYWMLSVPHTPQGWARFMEWVQDPVLLADPGLADEAERNAKQDFVLERLAQWSAQSKKEELVSEAQRRHTPAAPVTTPADLVHDPQLMARRFLRSVTHPELGEMIVPLGAVATVRGGQPGIAPHLGQHNEEILVGLGYTAAEARALFESGAL